MLNKALLLIPLLLSELVLSELVLGELVLGESVFAIVIESGLKHYRIARERVGEITFVGLVG